MDNKVSLYEPRKLMKLIKSTPPLYTFLRDTFFKNRRTFVTESFDVDFTKGKRELAPFCSDLVDGKALKNEGYVTKTYEGARIAPYTVTTAANLMHRMPGEALYSDRTPADRAVEKLENDLIRLDESLSRRIEWMCAKALFTGNIPIIGEGVNKNINFNFTNKITLTGDDKWNGANPKILRNIHDWKRQVQQVGYVNVDTMIIAEDVVEWFINNANLKELLDIKDYNIARIAPHDLPNGVTYIGTITSEGIDVYTYNELYLDDTQLGADGKPTLQPLVPSGTATLLARNTDYSVYFGAVSYIPENSENFTTVEGIRVPHSYVLRRPDRRILQLESRPMPIPHNVDSWLVAQVL